MNHQEWQKSLDADEYHRMNKPDLKAYYNSLLRIRSYLINLQDEPEFDRSKLTRNAAKIGIVEHVAKEHGIDLES